MDLKTAEQAGAIASTIDNLIAIQTAVKDAFDGGLLFREVTLTTGPTIIFLDSGVSQSTTKMIFSAFMSGLQTDIDNLTSELANL